METRYHIGLLTGTLLILAILSYAYYADYNYRKEIARTEQTEQQETEQTVSTQGGAHKEGVYYLKNRNGYVIVYLDDVRLYPGGEIGFRQGRHADQDDHCPQSGG